MCVKTFYVVLQGVNLTQAREKGQLVFLEGLKASPGVLLDEDTSDETRMFDYLRSVRLSACFLFTNDLYSLMALLAVCVCVYMHPVCICVFVCLYVFRKSTLETSRFSRCFCCL